MSISKDRKFLFDYNNFDLPDTLPEPEIYIEPPPLFSLDDLGEAKTDAFGKGRAAGLEEARVSREQYLAELTDRVSKELRFLIGAESYRAAVYERETIALTETIFKTLLPHFTEREGLSEIKAVISQVLINQEEQPSIVIELPEEDADAIKSYFASADIDGARLQFKASPLVSRASCKMSWKDGGALRDHEAIAQEILKTLRLIYHPTSKISEEASTEDAAPSLAMQEEKDETESESPPTDPTGE